MSALALGAPGPAEIRSTGVHCRGPTPAGLAPPRGLPSHHSTSGVGPEADLPSAPGLAFLPRWPLRAQPAVSVQGPGGGKKSENVTRLEASPRRRDSLVVPMRSEARVLGALPEASAPWGPLSADIGVLHSQRSKQGPTALSIPWAPPPGASPQGSWEGLWRLQTRAVPVTVIVIYFSIAESPDPRAAGQGCGPEF